MTNDTVATENRDQQDNGRPGLDLALRGWSQRQADQGKPEFDDQRQGKPWPTQDKQYLVLAVYAVPRADARHGHYVDLLNPRTTEKFIEMTHQKTFDQLGEKCFGQFEAAFTDEPKLCGPYPWTDSLPEDYADRYNRDFFTDLPHILLGTQLTGEVARLRYRRLLGTLWQQRYFQPIARWCSAHDVAFTGHVSPEEDPVAQAVITPNWMGTTAEMDWPGCDQISSRFGSLNDGYRCLGPKLASSVANQRRKDHVMVEALGVSGEGITLERMRRILDCLMACGCDQIAIHGQMLSLAGNRKREAPPSIFVQQPYWKFMGELSKHIDRTARYLNQGQPYRPIALLYPTAAFEAQMPNSTEALSWAKGFGELVASMMAAGLDFDLVSDVDLCDTALARLEGSALGVGAGRYETLVVPNIPLLDEPAVSQIQTWGAKGLPIFSLGLHRVVGSDRQVLLGEKMDGRAALLRHLITQHRSWLSLEEGAAVYSNSRLVDGKLQRVLWNVSDKPVQIYLQEEISGIRGCVPASRAGRPPYHELAPGAWWMSGGSNSSTSCDESSRQDACTTNKEILQPASDSLEIPWSGGWTLAPEAPNTLRLGQWQLLSEGKPPQAVDIPVVTGEFPEVQKGESVILETDFYIDELVKDLSLNFDCLAFRGAENLTGVTLSINDQSVAIDQAWPSDLPNTLELPVTALLQPGKNRIRLSIDGAVSDPPPLGEPLYLRGHFKLLNINHADKMVCTAHPTSQHVLDTAPLRLGALDEIIMETPDNWAMLGFPHYSGLMRYTSHFELQTAGCHVWLMAADNQNDPYEVIVNGKSVGQACWHPWRVELTSALRPGRNTVEIIIANTLINRIEGKPQPSGLLSQPKLLSSLRPLCRA